MGDYYHKIDYLKEVSEKLTKLLKEHNDNIKRLSLIQSLQLDTHKIKTDQALYDAYRLNIPEMIVLPKKRSIFKRIFSKK